MLVGHITGNRIPETHPQRSGIVGQQIELGLIRYLEVLHVPRTLPLLGVFALGPRESCGMRHGYGGQRRDPFGMPRGHGPSDGSSPVVSHEMHGVQPECVTDGDDVRDEFVELVGVDLDGAGAGRVTALIRCDRRVTGVPQQVGNSSPGCSRFGEPVQHQHSPCRR